MKTHGLEIETRSQLQKEPHQALYDELAIYFNSSRAWEIRVTWDKQTQKEADEEIENDLSGL